MKLKFLLIVALLVCSGIRAQDKKSKPIDHTFLGVDVNNISEKTHGLYVNGVYKGYGAEKAGLRPGDSLLSVNTTMVNSFDELVKTLDRYKPGEEIELTYVRNKSIQKTKASLSAYPEFLKYNRDIFSNAGDKNIIEIRRPKLGINISSLWEKYAVEVTGFTDDSPAQKAGLKTGDIIYKMDDQEFVSLEELTYALSRYTPGDTVILYILRDGQKISIPIALGEEIHRKEKKEKEKVKVKS